MTTSSIPAGEPGRATAGNRRLLLSCPLCGNSRTVAQRDDAPIGTLSLLECAACGGTWHEIVTTYSRASDEDNAVDV